MRIAISSTGAELDVEVSPVFGRCPVYLFADTETMQFEAEPNPAMSASGGAGIQAAQFVLSQGVHAVISGNLGPNAFQVLEAAGVPVYTTSGGTVREAVEAFKQGRLCRISGATTVAHAGMGVGFGRRMGRRGGRGQGIGRGGDRSPGPAEGRAVSPSASVPPAGTTIKSSKEELVALREEVLELRSQLDDVLSRLEQLS